MRPSISVIVCTHNPRPHYLCRVLEALANQTLPRSEWELLLVDNASKEPLAGAFDLSWSSRARHVREENLGLTPARERGIRESVSDLLLFVDDDNVLDQNYLETVCDIARRFPTIGAWGGQVIPEYELPPEPWMTPFCSCLALNSFEKDQWSNIPKAVMPYGAGLCLRRDVALEYLRIFESSPMRKSHLGRKGTSLMACEDSDMVLTAIDLGYGAGLFTGLKLTHLICRERISEDYLARVIEMGFYSAEILDALRGEWRPKSLPMLVRLNRWRYERGLDRRVRRLLRARRIGEAKAEAFIRQHLLKHN